MRCERAKELNVSNILGQMIEFTETKKKIKINKSAKEITVDRRFCFVRSFVRSIRGADKLNNININSKYKSDV